MADYETIQAAVDANPGRAVYVPDGDYLLSKEISISADGSELYGPGRLIQQDPNAGVVRIHDTSNVKLSGLTLTRATGHEVAEREGLA